MIEYFLYALLFLFILSFVKIRGRRIVSFKRFLFMLLLSPLIFVIVLFSSLVLVAVLALFVLLFIIAYVYMMFSKKKSKVIVIK